MRNQPRFRLIALIFPLIFAAPSAHAQGLSPRTYHVGDRVEWNDVDKKFGGGWLAATIVDQKSATGASFMLHLDGKSDTQNFEASSDLIRPLDAPKKASEPPIPGATPVPVPPPPVH